MRRQLLPAGTTSWLLAHELQLNLRAVTGRKGAAVSLTILAAVLVLITATGGFPLALWLTRTPLRLSPLLAISLDSGVLLIFTLILSQTLASAITAFYERGDLDLLLASPLPPHRVLIVRAVSVAVTPFLWFALFLTPIAVPLALMGQVKWLADYVVLACVALLAASAGLTLAMALFRIIGARATRTVGQILAALIGAVFFLISQARSLFPDSGRRFFGGVMTWAQSGPFEPNAPLSWPARAVMGEPIPLAVVIGVSITVFWLVAAALGRQFSLDAAVAAGVQSGSRKGDRRVLTTASFRLGVFSTMMRKELRLLSRDPTLLSQVLLRTLYVVPLTLILAKNAGHHPGVGVGLTQSYSLSAGAGAVTFMAGQVAGSLAWITISAEDAPELLACAPVDSRLVRRAKLTATMLPVALLLALPLVLLLALDPWIGVCAALGAAAAAGSSGLVNLWFEKPAPRKLFRSRRGGSVLGAIAELLLGLGWGVTAGMAAGGTPIALAPAALTLATMGLLYAMANPNRAY